MPRGMPTLVVATLVAGSSIVVIIVFIPRGIRRGRGVLSPLSAESRAAETSTRVRSHPRLVPRLVAEEEPVASQEMGRGDRVRAVGELLTHVESQLGANWVRVAAAVARRLLTAAGGRPRTTGLLPV